MNEPRMMADEAGFPHPLTPSLKGRGGVSATLPQRPPLCEGGTGGILALSEPRAMVGEAGFPHPLAPSLKGRGDVPATLPQRSPLVKGGTGGICIIALLTLLLSGCGGGAAKRLPQARLDAVACTERGIAAQAGGHQDDALAQFGEALRLQSSIENNEGMVVALVNIARTERLKGMLAPARESIDRAVSLLPESSTVASEVCFEKAKILLAAGDLAAAKEWALRAEGAEKGDAAGRMANLTALISLKQGLRDQAREQAERARNLNRSVSATQEEANSLRLLAEISLAKGEGKSARELFGQALGLDKDLGLGRKVAADLRGVACAAAVEGDKASAIAYYRRSMEASLNGGDRSAAAGDMARLAGLYRATGQEKLARQIEEDLNKLPPATPPN
ncbi:tetratricopeptide repeat protein [Geomonas sp. Red32]|uniref:tetratricopeptide repeat protein n=1 Tax=Geomonas sp. Red32 TaxID=2912856 RepID=UPI00202CEDE0|nr:tetratricopeptide repeat protein [Geomonas sp. Red32]MCM0083528.1 tetratricopeptide repeat protein [Geomonas sp. Red32]